MDGSGCLTGMRTPMYHRAEPCRTCMFTIQPSVGPGSLRLGCGVSDPCRSSAFTARGTSVGMAMVTVTGTASRATTATLDGADVATGTAVSGTATAVSRLVTQCHHTKVVMAYLLGLGTGRLLDIALPCPKEDSPVEAISTAIAGIVLLCPVADFPVEVVSAATADTVLLHPMADPPVESAMVVIVEVATVDMGDRTFRSHLSFAIPYPVLKLIFPNNHNCEFTSLRLPWFG